MDIEFLGRLSTPPLQPLATEIRSSPPIPTTVGKLKYQDVTPLFFPLTPVSSPLQDYLGDSLLVPLRSAYGKRGRVLYSFPHLAVARLMDKLKG